MPSSFFTKAELMRLYRVRRLSTYDIATRKNCDPKTVYYWLQAYHISTRPRKIVPIQKKTLISLYRKGLSLKTIGKRFHITAGAVFKKMEQYHLQRRTPWNANIIYKRINFSEHGIEKAYLVGFRIGDLYVTHNKSSVTIKSNTTQLAQVNLMKSLFSQYGPIWVSSPQSRKNVYHCTVTLNHSFQFLMKKPSTIPLWISRSSHAFWAFIAGYTDAEGTIRIYSSRARLRVGSYDKMILKQIHLWLIKNGIKNSFRLESPADFVHRNGDFYRVDIMDRYALYTTLQHLIPLLRHERRKKDAIEALLNVTRRIKHLI